MTFATAFKLLLFASIFANVLALGLRSSASDMLYLFREWRLGLRAFIAMFVVVPAVAIALAYAFRLGAPVEIALVALAFSPVPPLLPNKQHKAGGSDAYIVGLLVGASIVSLVVTPLGLAIASGIFGVEAEIGSARIAATLGIGIGAPLVLGLLAQSWLGESAAKVSALLARGSMIVLLLCVVVLIVLLAPAMWSLVRSEVLVAMAAMIAAGLTAGYVLAGSNPEQKAALSLASAARHPGIALAIATLNFPDEKLAPAAIVLFALFNAVISLPYLKQLDRFAKRGPAVA